MEQFLTKIWEALAELAMSVGLKLVYAILLLIIGLRISRFICKRLAKSRAFEKMETGVSKFIVNLVKVFLNTLIFISAALILGVPATSFITILGSAGLAIGMALQGSLSNVAGSIMIMIFKPYKVGDFVEAAGVSGTVQEINLFYTVLTTPDNKRITCPNGAVSNAVIVDYSTEETRRVDLSFSVAYGTDVTKMRTLLLETAAANGLVLKDPAPDARLSSHGDSALTFHLRVWCNAADYWTVYFDLMEAVNGALVQNNIEIPFPQVDVHMKQ